MLAPPAALVASIVGVIMDRRKGYAIAGLVISGLACSLGLLAFFA